MSQIKTATYIHKPLYVEAIQVTADNLEDVAEWCAGKIEIEEVGDKNGLIVASKYIRVRVNRPTNSNQTKARVKDWVTKSAMGFKVFTDFNFNRAYTLFYERACGNTAYTTDRMPCVLVEKHR